MNLNMFELISYSCLPFTNYDKRAEMVDFGDCITISPRYEDFEIMDQVWVVKWGLRMPQPIPWNVLPNRYLVLMLPPTYRESITGDMLPNNVQLFLHESNVSFGPINKPFFLWKEGSEPFVFRSEDIGKTYQLEGQALGKAYSYLAVRLEVIESHFTGELKVCVRPSTNTLGIETLRSLILTKNEQVYLRSPSINEFVTQEEREIINESNHLITNIFSFIDYLTFNGCLQSKISYTYSPLNIRYIPRIISYTQKYFPHLLIGEIVINNRLLIRVMVK